MAETVDVVPDGDIRSQLGLKIILCHLPLFEKRSCRWNITVGLNPPAADRLEPSGHDMLLQTSEQFAIMFLNGGVKPGFAASDNNFRVIIEQFAGGTGGGENFVDALGPRPEPNRIEMGIENQMVLAWSVVLSDVY